MEYKLLIKRLNTYEIANNITPDIINKREFAKHWHLFIYKNDLGHISANIFPFISIMDGNTCLFKLSYLYAYDIYLNNGEELTSKDIYQLLHSSLCGVYEEYLKIIPSLSSNFKYNYNLTIPKFEDMEGFINDEITNYKLRPLALRTN